MTNENFLAPEDRIAIFIDGYFFSQLKNDSENETMENVKKDSFEKSLNPMALKAWVESESRLVRANFYAVLKQGQPEEKTRIVNFLTFLSLSGYHVHKQMLDYSEKKLTSKAYAVKMAVDLLVFGEHVDHILLFSMENELHHAVEALQARGKKVSLVYNPRNRNVYRSRRLLLSADQHIDYCDLLSIVPQIEKIKDKTKEAFEGGDLSFEDENGDALDQ